ncbi:MAG: hypothetical protein GXO35_01240, partial [Gammaproteobacteria bacterium]|nr:hypothetical protein [Gammaproteobacteria bacterium]
MGLSTAYAAKTAVQEDFHLSLYEDARGQVSALELFTKMPDREVYLGLTCTDMSPFPLLQVLLFNDEVLIESPRLLDIHYRIKDGMGAEVRSEVMLQGVLKPIDTADEYSNKVRLELKSGQVKSMNVMLEKYQALLFSLRSGSEIELTLTHRTLGEHAYRFSLKGLNGLLTPYESVCH